MAGPASLDAPREERAADETTPLLGTNQATLAAPPIDAALDANRTTAAPAADDEADKPLPVFEITILSMGRFMEAVAFFSIVPFINQMVKDNSDLTDEEVPAWSGIIESLFSITQMLLMIQYGRAADYFGRKAVLMWSLAGLSVTVSIFGLAKSIPQMILFRCLSGSFGSLVLTVRTMISDKSTKATQGQAFSIFAVVSNIGIFIGPLLGGALANPVKLYPGVFGNIPFFHEYPYALPSFVAGGLSGIIFILEAVFVTESLPKNQSSSASGAKPVGVIELLKMPGVGMVVFLVAAVQFVGLSYTAIAPAWMFTPIRSGGTGFDELHISLATAFAGISQTLWMLFVFTPLQRNLGTGFIYRWSTRVWTLNFVFYPACNLLLRYNQVTAFHAVFWPGSLVAAGVAMAFTAAQLTLNDIAPSPQTLGTLNGISLSIASAIRAAAPAAMSAVYSIGIQRQILWGYLVWAVLCVTVTLVSLCITFYLPAAAEGKITKAPPPATEDNVDDARPGTN